MNTHGIQAIYRFEMARWFRTIGQSLFSPVLSTSLYFIVFGSVFGSRLVEIGGGDRRAHRRRQRLRLGEVEIEFAGARGERQQRGPGQGAETGA